MRSILARIEILEEDVYLRRQGFSHIQIPAIHYISNMRGWISLLEYNLICDVQGRQELTVVKVGDSLYLTTKE